MDGCGQLNTIRGAVYLDASTGQQSFKKMSIHHTGGPGLWSDTAVSAIDSVFYKTTKYGFFAEKRASKVVLTNTVLSNNMQRDSSSYSLSNELTATVGAFYTSNVVITDNAIQSTD